VPPKWPFKTKTAVQKNALLADRRQVNATYTHMNPICLGAPWKEHQVLKMIKVQPMLQSDDSSVAVLTQCRTTKKPLFKGNFHFVRSQLDTWQKIDKETIRKWGKRQFWPNWDWAPSLCQCPGILVKCHGDDSRISYGLRCAIVVPQLWMSGSMGLLSTNGGVLGIMQLLQLCKQTTVKGYQPTLMRWYSQETTVFTKH
jgi:hypothetical protein